MLLLLLLLSAMPFALSWPRWCRMERARGSGSKERKINVLLSQWHFGRAPPRPTLEGARQAASSCSQHERRLSDLIARATASDWQSLRQRVRA